MKSGVVLWEPSTEAAQRAQVTGLWRFINERHGTALSSYADLHRWSVENPGSFWTAVWDVGGVVGERGDRAFVAADELIDARFFPDARINAAENLMKRNNGTPAIVFRGESGTSRTVSWRELHEQVSVWQQAMKAHGVTTGDRVVAWLPNIPETYFVMLAAVSLGAVFSSSSPDFGVDGVLDRFGQIEPVLLFATDAYAYGGKRHDCLERLEQITAKLPSLGATVVVPYLDDSVPAEAIEAPGAMSLEEFISGYSPRPVTFEHLPFDHPWYILFSSGTTGPPKCIVHRAGGVILKHIAEFRFQCDVRSGERVFFFTTAGWMMWNWLASALLCEATVVLYDGSPFEPDGNRLFDLADDTAANLFGISAKFIDAVAKEGLEPAKSHDLSSIRMICSTGSTLLPESFEFVYRSVKADVHLVSMTGGTDLCGCLVAGQPTGAVRTGELQAPALGLDVDVSEADGSATPAGKSGELVCRNAFPSMPLRFFGDADDTKYRAAYFDRIPGVWHQGDFAEWTEAGGMVLHGRSDATLNPGGVRIGTSEIYRQVEQLEEVLEALVIGQSHDGDTRVVLFVVLRKTGSLDDALRAKIRSAIRTGASPRHVPAVIAEVPELPRTRSGKIVELAVRDTVEGRPVGNANALANPESLEAFAHHRDLV